jgi:Domain of unknown function (DUF1851)
LLESLQSRFPLDPWTRPPATTVGPKPDVPALGALLEQYGGASFGNGIYRIMRPADLDRWRNRVELGFPAFVNRIVCFGFDWLGCVFALDLKSQEDGKHGLLLFEPGSGDALEIPGNLESFHDAGLLEFGEAALAIDFHREWLGSGGAVPKFDQCIGYKVPLFLGGADEIGNLSVADIDVYWNMSVQLLEKTKSQR